MPITLGILAQSRQAVATGAFDLLETASVGSGGQASVEFTNLTTKYAATYQHLQVRMVTKNGTSAGDSTLVQLNGDTATNYSIHYLYGTGSSVVSDAAANLGFMFVGREGNGTNIFGNGVMDLLDPFETTKNKTIRSLAGANNGSNNSIFLFSGAWRNTASVTSLKFYSSTGTNLLQGSRISLYGVKATA